MSDLGAMFRVQTESRGIDFSIEMEPGIPQFIEGDEAKVGQVLINLLSNAVKFTWKSAISVDFSLVEETEAEDTLVVDLFEKERNVASSFIQGRDGFGR